MIRLMPQSPRGTWLLAGAVWLAGVGVLWWALPIVPRTTWELERPGRLLGFTPDDAVLVTSSSGVVETMCSFGRSSVSLAWEGGPQGPVRFWDVGTRRECRPAWEEREFVGQTRVSAAGHVLRYTGPIMPTGNELHIPFEGPVLKLPEQEAELAASPPVPAADRWLVYAPKDDWDVLRVWDLHERRLAGTVPTGRRPDVSAPGPFPQRTADGRYLVTSAADGQAMQLWDLNSLRVVTRIPMPNGLYWFECSLSADARRIAILYGPEEQTEVRCYDTATGDELLRAEGMKEMVLSPDGQTLVTTHWPPASEYGPIHLKIWDVAGGRLRADHAAFMDPRYPYPFADCLSPDGRWLVVSLDGDTPHPLNEIAEMLGLNRPFREKPRGRAEILNVGTGESAGEFPACAGSVAWGHDGRTVATLDIEGCEVQIWDVPLRKRWAWVVSGAGLWACPVVFLARRRNRLSARESFK